MKGYDKAKVRHKYDRETSKQRKNIMCISIKDTAAMKKEESYLE